MGGGFTQDLRGAGRGLGSVAAGGGDLHQGQLRWPALYGRWAPPLSRPPASFLLWAPMSWAKCPFCAGWVGSRRRGQDG